MKGTIIKTDQGWMVEYLHQENTPVGHVQWLEKLPLYSAEAEMVDACFTSKFTQEIEFEIVNETYNGGKGCVYAKLINHTVESNEMICTFEPRTDTTSATICKHCGQEKFLHQHLVTQQNDIRKDNIEMTAVEWLVRKLSTELIGEIPLHRWDEIKDAVQQAKAMGKKQIKKAHIDGSTWPTIEDKMRNSYAELYYNEQYEK